MDHHGFDRFPFVESQWHWSNDSVVIFRRGRDTACSVPSTWHAQRAPRNWVLNNQYGIMPNSNGVMFMVAAVSANHISGFFKISIEFGKA